MSNNTNLTPLSADSDRPSILPKPPLWWKSLTCIYQIYPASFLYSHKTTSSSSSSSSSTTYSPPSDSKLPNPPTSGLGDIPAITSRVPYLSSLGVDCIWLSPVYPSPLIDMGYDVSDYTTIHPLFGTLSDMENLIRTAHSHGIRVLMDLVINHTSDQHRWFQESMKSKQGEFADFYIWKDPQTALDENGNEVQSPPNNWGSFFGNSAWTYVPARRQYYLHLFAPQQPDLNFENPRMRKAVYDDAIRFWLRRGVDGFRVDTCAIYSKDQRFPDGEMDKDDNARFAKYGNPAKYVISGPRIHEFWREIRREVLEEWGDVLMVGELGPIDQEEILKYVARERGELSMVFDFELAKLGLSTAGVWEPQRWTLSEMKDGVAKNQDLVREREKGGWGSIFTENHDVPRGVTRLGSKEGRYWERSAKLLAMMLATLSGTLVVYQGQEIGMTNIPEGWNIGDLTDLASIEYYERMKREHPGDEEFLEKAWKGIVAVTRDNARTPMQWSGEKNAGFSIEKPWMKVNDNYKDINFEDQKGRADSVWSFWKKMLSIRKDNPGIWVDGDFRVHDHENEKTFTFEKRETQGRVAFVVLNFSEEGGEVTLPEPDGKKVSFLVSSIGDGSNKLHPWEGKVFLEL